MPMPMPCQAMGWGMKKGQCFPPFQLSGSQGQHSHDPEHGYGWIWMGTGGREGREGRRASARQDEEEEFSREVGPQPMITGSIVLVL